MQNLGHGQGCGKSREITFAVNVSAFVVVTVGGEWTAEIITWS